MQKIIPPINLIQTMLFIYFSRKLVFWWGHLGNIWFSEPNFMKFENQLLMWKVIYFSCTLSRVHILCRDCPFWYPGQQHPKAMLARAKTEPLKNSKIKIWPSQKNTLADNTCNVLHLGLSLSLIWYPFLLSFFTPSLRRSRESCIFFKIFSHFSLEALNPKLQSTLFFLQPLLLSKSWPFVPDRPNFLIPDSNRLYVLIEILVKASEPEWKQQLWYIGLMKKKSPICLIGWNFALTPT